MDPNTLTFAVTGTSAESIDSEKPRINNLSISVAADDINFKTLTDGGKFLDISFSDSAGLGSVAPTQVNGQT